MSDLRGEPFWAIGSFDFDLRNKEQGRFRDDLLQAGPDGVEIVEREEITEVIVEKVGGEILPVCF